MTYAELFIEVTKETLQICVKHLLAKVVNINNLEHNMGFEAAGSCARHNINDGRYHSRDKAPDLELLASGAQLMQSSMRNAL